MGHRVGLEAAKRETETERESERENVFLCWESSQDSPVAQFTDRGRPAPGIRYAVESKDTVKLQIFAVVWVTVNSAQFVHDLLLNKKPGAKESLRHNDLQFETTKPQSQRYELIYLKINNIKHKETPVPTFM